MNHLPLSCNLKSVIFNYLNKSKDEIKLLNYRNSRIIKYMKGLFTTNFKFITQRKFNEYWHNSIINSIHVGYTININNKFVIYLEYKYILNKNISVSIDYICHINKLKRQICNVESDIILERFNENFNEDINHQLNNLLNYIELFYICKYCFSVCWEKENKIQEICNKCININYEDKYEICSLCNLKCKIDTQLCKLKCNHYFHLNCISNIKTYEFKCYYYIKCPICNINCLYVYMNNKIFEIDEWLYIHYEDDIEEEEEIKEKEENINIKDIEKNELKVINTDEINLPKYY